MNLLVNVAKYGVGSVIALYLAYQLGSELPIIKQDVSAIKIEHSSFDDKMDSAIINGKSRDQEIQGLLGEMVKIQRGQCLNMADSKLETQRCNQ